MNTITKWATSKAEGVFVWLPANALRPILFNDQQPYLSYDVLVKFIGLCTQREYLPAGTYRLLGKGDAVTEEDAESVVEYITVCSGFEDYYYPRCRHLCLTARESLHSLILSHSLNPPEVVVLVKVN